jgi:hypothetical protein
MDDIKVDDRELQKFSQELKIRKPSQVSAIVRTVLNEEAFATRKNAQKQTIPQLFNNRSTWVASSVLVDKAEGRDTKTMQSEVGGKKRWKRNSKDSFSGLADQEFGRSIFRPDIPTTSISRSGAFSKKVRPSTRYNKLGLSVVVSGGGTREIGILRQLDRQGYKGGIKIKNSKRFRKGVYKFSNRKFSTPSGQKLRKLDLIKDQSKSSTKLIKRQWLRKAVGNAVNNRTVGRFYRKAFQRFTKQRAK